MRIGELATRTGVSTHVLRAWESRYGLLSPTRSPGGYRLYGADDERRVREVCSLRDQGVSAMEAARQVLAAERNGIAATEGESVADESPEHGDERSGMRADPPLLVAQLLDAVTALDEDRAHAVLDTAFLDRSVESAVVDVLVPFFVKVGEHWELGKIGIAQEHFASSLVRRRLGALSMTWGLGTGPVAVLACPPGEFHDIILLSFGVLLGRSGWRVRYLGPDTPVVSLRQAADLTEPDAVVLASRRPSGFRGHASQLRSLADQHPLWLAGRGTTPRVLDEIGAESLGGDLVAAVQTLTETARERRRERGLPPVEDAEQITERAAERGVRASGDRSDSESRS
ncbi:MerR family transcriptional regulator [Phycicoccus sp. BSK3Z-2]|uniref:MerR family transcriptional regulator n=1 Tax=Phycicoccus avicenniae TaxID=2828860 RepID=A0A941HZ25_9MICO|nr:MerR family transcriptional regulator [Phycicoccus avicenniae]MBR7741801.1 MerR family transcriptional regulator [Phycicoccus avicenniae]